MPLKFVEVVKIKVPKSSVGAQEVLQITSSVVSLTKELTNLSGFPPAAAAVGIVLLMLQTIQGIQNNKDACFGLTRKCARILLDIGDQMEGRWDSAPPTLLRNLERFQATLRSIHDFMQHQSDISWTQRFMRKSSIEMAISDFTADLNEAAQSFQIATLIDIHYAISSVPSSSKSQTSRQPTAIMLPPPYTSGSQARIMEADETEAESIVVASPTDMSASFVSSITTTSDSKSTGSSFETEAEYEIISDQALEDRGFRRYHQSEVRLKGRSKIRDGWWAGVSTAEVDGRQTSIKRYEGPHAQACELWMQDVKFLQDLYHPNLPEMLGFSAEGAPTPFILLSNVQTRSPQNLLLNELSTRGVAATAQMILKFYEDIVDATTYVRRQHGLNETQTQDFVGDASYRVDGFPKVILGVPSSKDVWMSVRNYNLTESLNMALMKMLPKSEAIKLTKGYSIDADDATRRLSHLVTLLRGMLPTEKDPIVLPPRVKSLIEPTSSEGEDEDFEDDLEIAKPQLSLRQLRLSNLQAGRHEHCWHENSNIPAYRFKVGDYGYNPPGSKGFSDFIILGNILKEDRIQLPVDQHTRGIHWNWKDWPVRHVPLEPFALPPNVNCWPMAVPPNQQIDCQISHSSGFKSMADAWNFLLSDAAKLARKHDVRPEDVILIAGAGTDQDFYIKDFRNTAGHFQHQVPVFGHPPNRPGFPPQPNSPFNRPGMAMFHQQPTIPSILYLLTSPSQDYQPYWCHNPVSNVNPPDRPDLIRGWTYKIGWCTGFIHWIQLYSEDFEG